MTSSASGSATSSSSAWRRSEVAGTSTSSFADVMSEQLAEDLQRHEDEVDFSEKGEEVNASEAVYKGSNPLEVEDPCANDLLIAQMLQMQYNKEHDASVGAEERHINDSSKVSVSLDNYRVGQANTEDYDHDYDDEEVDDDFIDGYERASKSMGALPRCGYRRVGNTIVTKHDKTLSGQRNGRRMMELDTHIATGDGVLRGKYEMEKEDDGNLVKLSNNVFNEIKSFAFKDSKRRYRVKDKEDKSTAEMAVDDNTRVMLLKMINNAVLDTIDGIVSTGKEAVILHAEGNFGDQEQESRECVIKVFKTSLNEFKTRREYLREIDGPFEVGSRVKWMSQWAERELINLNRMRKVGVRAPEPILLKKHVLIMEFIGEQGRPGAKLKDYIKLKSDKSDLEATLNCILEEIVHFMQLLYHEARLVHGDLSEYNVLIHENNCWFIDVGQAVEVGHERANAFLLRDCQNVASFFRKQLGDNVVDHHVKMFAKVLRIEDDLFNNNEEDNVLNMDSELLLEQVKVLQRHHLVPRHQVLFSSDETSCHDEEESCDYTEGGLKKSKGRRVRRRSSGKTRVDSNKESNSKGSLAGVSEEELVKMKNMLTSHDENLHACVE